mgnify:CR=1 FL=1
MCACMAISCDGYDLDVWSFGVMDPCLKERVKPDEAKDCHRRNSALATAPQEMRPKGREASTHLSINVEL